MAKSKVKVPALRKGRRVVGPDYVGCFNSGFAPALAHATWGAYIVGPECLLGDQRLRAKMWANGHGKRVYRDGRHTAYVYKTRKAAVARFTALCDKVHASNGRDRQEAAAACAKLRSSNPTEAIGAAFALSDLGMI